MHLSKSVGGKKRVPAVPVAAKKSLQFKCRSGGGEIEKRKQGKRRKWRGGEEGEEEDKDIRVSKRKRKEEEEEEK